MTGNLTLRGIVNHWVTKASAAFTAGSMLFHVKALDVIALYVWANIGEFFTIVSLAGFTLVPQIPAIPEKPFVIAAVVTAVLYILKKGLEMYRGLNHELETDQSLDNET